MNYYDSPVVLFEFCLAIIIYVGNHESWFVLTFIKNIKKIT